MKYESGEEVRIGDVIERCGQLRRVVNTIHFDSATREGDFVVVNKPLLLTDEPFELVSACTFIRRS